MKAVCTIRLKKLQMFCLGIGPCRSLPTGASLSLALTSTKQFITFISARGRAGKVIWAWCHRQCYWIFLLFLLFYDIPIHFLLMWLFLCTMQLLESAKFYTSLRWCPICAKICEWVLKARFMAKHRWLVYHQISDAKQLHSLYTNCIIST